MKLLFFKDKYEVYTINDDLNNFVYDVNALKKINETIDRKIYHINYKGERINVAFENKAINEAIFDLTAQLRRYSEEICKKLEENKDLKKELREIKSYKFWYKIYELLRKFKWK